MRPARFATLLAVGLLCAASAAPAAQILNDTFDTYTSNTDLAAAYTGITAATTTQAINSTAGIGGSGAVTVVANSDITYFRKSLSVNINTAATGTEYTDSLMFKYLGTGLAAPQIGFSTSNAFNSTTDIGGRYNNGKLVLRSANADASTAVTVTLTSGNWYQLVFDAVKTSTAGTFNASISLYSVDATTGAVGSLAGTQTGTVTNATVYGSASVAMGFRVNAPLNSAYDNFVASTATPEPAALGIVGLASTLLLRRRKRD